MDFDNKKILIIGMGRSGMASIKVLHNLGVDVIATDMKSEEFLDDDFLKYLNKEKIPHFFGETPDIKGVDIVALSPGVPPTLEYVEKAREAGIEIVGELELAYRVGHGKYLAITGTNGKTTTVSLVGDIIDKAKEKNIVVGNIGIAAIGKTVDADDDTWVVTEVSSFQLETIKEFHPFISAILNITPDHMDRHKNMENYANIKGRIFENQDKGDFTVVNFDDKRALSLTANSKATIVPFSAEEKMKFGVCLKDGNIVVIDGDGKETIICQTEDLRIPGLHNLQNALAAVAITFFAGINPKCIRKSLKEFQGVEHRIELCGTVKGVQYINDSKGTNPDASIKAIEAMDGDTIIIAGGYDKGSDFTEFVKAFKDKVTHAIFIGTTAVKLKGTCEKEGFANTIIVEDMEQAVLEASRLAKRGNNVLLSPACASWDMYGSFEERGEDFKNSVKKLEE